MSKQASAKEQSYLHRLIRGLIRSFSYKGKLRFILLCSYLPVCILLAVIPLLLNGPIADLQCKINGMARLDEEALVYLQKLSPQTLDQSERVMASLKQDPKLACAFSLLQRDNGGRRLLQALDWELPESRSALASILTTAFSAPQQREPSQQLLAQLYINRQKLSESVERTADALDLAYRSNPDLMALTPDIQAWREKVSAFDALSAKADRFKTVKDLTAGITPPGLSLLKDTLELQKKLYIQSENILQIQMHTLKRARLISLLSLFAGGLIVALFYLSENIRHPLADLNKALHDLSKGSHIQLPISSQDEMIPIVTAFNQLSTYLEGICKDISGIKKRMKEAFENIHQTSARLEDNIESQAATARQVATGSRNIFTSAQTISDELIGASHSAITTGALAATGDEGLHQMATIMQDMLTASSNIVTTLSVLQEEVGTINNVIIAIVKIADQSNLLSLNTAIRASKSGIQGRGFTVIAERIREMADQIALVTLDIEKSVQEIVKTVLEASDGVNAFSENIRHQVQETGDISTQLKQLIGDTQDQVHRFEKIKEEMQLQMQQIALIKQITTDIKKGSTATHKLVHTLKLNTRADI